MLGGVRVLRVGVREVGLEHDVVVAHPAHHVGDEAVVALGGDPAVAPEVLGGRHRELGRLGRARELEVLVDAVQPRRQPPAARLHVGDAQAREPLEHAVHDHRQQRGLRLVRVHDGVPLGERVEPVGSRGRRVEPHVLVGRERAVEILEQLVDRVVVAVAEVAVVELVGPGPEAADARARRARTGSPRPHARRR